MGGLDVRLAVTEIAIRPLSPRRASGEREACQPGRRHHDERDQWARSAPVPHGDSFGHPIDRRPFIGSSICHDAEATRLPQERVAFIVLPRSSCSPSAEWAILATCAPPQRGPGGVSDDHVHHGSDRRSEVHPKDTPARHWSRAGAATRTPRPVPPDVTLDDRNDPMTTRRFPLARSCSPSWAGSPATSLRSPGSFVLGVLTGLLVLGIGLFAIWVATRDRAAAHDPERRRLPARRRRRRPRLGVRRAGPRVVHAQGRAPRSADLCRRRWPPTWAPSTWSSCSARTTRAARAISSCCLAPFNSSNYTFESLTVVPQDPRTSHASSWMYLELIPLVVHAPGIVVASDSEDRVTLADLAPTTAGLDRCRAGRATVRARRSHSRPRGAPRSRRW